MVLCGSVLVCAILYLRYIDDSNLSCIRFLDVPRFKWLAAIVLHPPVPSEPWLMQVDGKWMI